MARPLATAVGRPPPSQRSFHGYRESAGPSVGDDVVPHIRYEGYNITPEDSEYHDKWHRAHIRPMPVTQREFENLIQKQSLSDNPVTKELCGPRMTNSKTECIASHIDARDALDPEREHELAYLKLERRHRSKSSKKTTVSMQIIFECKIRPPSNKVPALQAVATHGSRIINGNSSAASSVPTTNPNAGTILTVPVGASRPQYTPTYALQRGLSSTDNCQKVNADKGRDSRDPSILTLALARSDYDSDESDDLRAPSQCSIVSSDTVMSSSRRTSSSSVSNSNTPATSQIAKDGNLDGSPCTTGYAPRDRLDERWNTKQCTGDSSLQPQYRRHSDTEGVVLPQKYHYADQRHVLECLYIDTGTQTDPELNESCCGGSFLDRNEREKPNAKSVELADHGSSSKKDCVLGDQSEEGEKATSKHDAAKDIDPTVKEASVKDRSTESFEKPAWMNNLRPGSLANNPLDDCNEES